MRKRVVSVALAVALAVAPMGVGSVATAAPLTASQLQTLALKSLAKSSAKSANTAATAADDAAVNGWTIDAATNKTGTTLEAGSGEYAGWTHFKSGTGNGNQAGTASAYPAVAVSNTTVDMTKAGSYTATVKSAQDGKLNRFGFYLGYTDPGSGLFVGYDAGGWFWQTYTGGGSGDWYNGDRLAAPAAGAEVKIELAWTGSKLSVKVNGEKAFDDVDYSAMTNLTNKLAMKAGTFNGTNGTELTDVYVKDENTAPVVKYTVSGKVTKADGTALKGVSVSTSGATATTGDDGTYTLKDLAAGKYTLTFSADGYDDVTKDVTVSDANVADINVSMNETAPVETETLSTADMDVQVKKNFPSVLQYTMKKLDGKVMYGQPKDVRDVTINGTKLTLKDSDVTFKTEGKTKAVYTLKVKDEAKKIDGVLTVEISVVDNTLKFNVTDVKNNIAEKDGNVEKNAIQTIAFPNQSLISVRSSQEGAQFTGARMSSDTARVGDTNYNLTATTVSNEEDYTYGFISGGGLSAGLWSNSEHDGKYIAAVNGGAKNTRVLANTQKVGADTSLGLGTAPYYWHRTVTDSKKRQYTVDQTDYPKMAVAIAGDENEDGKINWEDGAIAYRDIMNNPYKSEEVPELVSWRISMNFGSQAQNPFLTTLDNVKKVALNTDGLGQSVLLKGYGNEGHDSGHPDYADVNKRAGGVTDMNTLMEKGAEYGARFGVHVNASEMYPEAKAFSEDMVRRNSSDGLSYGWNWLDQGVGIDGIYDLASGSRNSRFAAFSKEVGKRMDFIYLDVWGNNTSGAEDSWETRKMSQMINDKGWRMTTEWGTGNEYDSTFQHWAADLTYGGSGMKGENSQVMRFLRNHQKDSWVGDYPSYGQAANAPLLGGYSMKDFEGWQGRNDYAAYIENLYTHDVSTKFIQHFKVTQWVNSPLDSTSVQDASINNGNEQITLKDDSGNTVVLKRGSNNTAEAGYRDRTITLNGIVVSTGRVAPGNGTADANANETYLLPWLWDVNTGKFVESKNEKLYHWNTKGGTTEWTLPKDWQSLSNVKVYQLTDQGKTNEKTVKVTDGKISLTAEAKTPYVVTKGDEKQIQVKWSEGMHVVDAGFNDAKTLDENWTATGSGKAAVVGTSNAVLKLTGAVKVSQKLTDLEAGKEYAIYLGVDNRSNSAAKITVTNGGKVLATNKTGKSVAKNYVKAYAHNTNTVIEDGVAGSYFQNMYVWFTAPESGDVTVTLSHDAGTDATAPAYFDDVRVLKNGYKGLTLNADGTLKTLTNDFEDNAQGIWPFVIGPIEGVEDNRTHLSELHAPFTQAGWDVKKMDDVLDGNWSLKTNGLTQRSAIVYQTIPQNVKLEPGQTYKVSFKYQAGSDNTYAFIVGDGENNIVKTTDIAKAMGKDADGTFTATITGSVTGDTWFGIYSTSTAPDLQGSTGSAQDFGGYKDFIMDDLKVENVASKSHTKAEAQAQLKEVTDTYGDKSADYSADAWAVYVRTVAQIRAKLNKDGATAADYTEAYDLAVALAAYMETAAGDDSSDAYDVATDDYTVEAGSVEATQGGDSEGPADLAQDGNASTQWHTAYGENAVGNGTAWYQFNLTEPTTITGLRYLPRSGGANANGKIKKYKITLTLANGTTRDAGSTTKEVTGEFSTTTEWQKATFDAVENVTAVRLTVLSSAGQTANQENKFASAAELRVTTDRDVPPTVVPVDKSDLQSAYDEAAALNAAGYTEDSWAKLVAARDAAKKVLADEKATQDEVALATENLKTAIAGLKVEQKVDTTALADAVASAEKAGLKESDYTKDSWARYAKALASAKGILAKTDATQDEVNAALKELQDATAALKKAEVNPTPTPGTVDKAGLNATIKKAQALSLGGYTDASAKAVRDALAKAQAVANDPDATQAEVDAAQKALDAAIAKLEKKTPGENKGNGLSKTGASVATVALAGMVLAGVAGGVMISRRKRA
ncbi:endo-alpha-N-acetylgalactosaminidase family protein [Bifidobacterium leontopitheci]|uniref:Endo-alpha-N-acetylgalactosaminidase n=1 Tax=Bifidobacterium leontopitheci TaxID=2650774 RepID=A0A6I1GE50_9BIFI|nr:endo-alpha-N-acetylgalactosaminidase family protein [Bifidobacterium leontopitheci]KAB7789913.1 Endo-alpha-N-acetylgalactosaminidase [Bifidobacterium leontopitheci]